MCDLATQVQFWLKNLDLPPEQVQELERTLSEDEKARAMRFHFEKHRRRFIVTRSSLRELLAQYLDLAPQDIKFEYSPKGKPFLAGQQLQFNVSHSHELALYGFARSRRIGVDLEQIRPVKDLEQLAARFFCPSEAEILQALSGPEKETAFFQIWTAKEAYLKAIGEGLAGGLDRVEVSLASGQVQKFLRLAGDERAAEGWHLWSFFPNPDYVATIAVEGSDRPLSFQLFDFSGRSLHLWTRGVKI